MKKVLLILTAMFLVPFVGSSAKKPTVIPPDDANVAVRQELKFPEGLWTPEEGGEDLVAPILVKVRRPVYPNKLNGTGVSGYAIIDYVIEADGRTTHVQVVEASNRYFAVSARSAVDAWKYRPAFVDGKPVALRAQQKFQFDEK
jgi:TonB family protein